MNLFFKQDGQECPSYVAILSFRSIQFTNRNSFEFNSKRQALARPCLLAYSDRSRDSASVGGRQRIRRMARSMWALIAGTGSSVDVGRLRTSFSMRAAMNSQRKARGEPEVSAPDFLKLSKLAAAKLRIDPDMLKRPLNVGFSGGEKKRLEIYQMLMLEPRFMILDETDSGLDIDALKVVAEGVNALRGPGRGMLVITHYQRLLDYIKPDRVHILSAGRIVKSGGPELALELEKSGYDQFQKVD